MSSTVAPDAPFGDGLPPPAADRAFAIGVAASVLAHAALIAVAIIRLEFGKAIDPAPPIPVELVRDKPPPPPPPPPPQEQAAPKPDQAPTPPPSGVKPKPAFDEAGPPPSAPGSAGAKSDAGQGELETLRTDIERCWTLPQGWTDPKQVTVVVDFGLTVEGAVIGTPTVIEFAANQYGAVAAKNAIEAVMKCGPYRLPPQTYQNWSHVQVRLAPP